MAFRKLHRMFKTGVEDYPELYFATLQFAVAAIGVSYFAIKQANSNEFVSRYKRVYTVMRPDDERAKMYPKSYFAPTDRHLLAPDHPEELTDCMKMLPPIANRQEEGFPGKQNERLIYRLPI